MAEDRGNKKAKGLAVNKTHWQCDNAVTNLSGCVMCLFTLANANPLTSCLDSQLFELCLWSVLQEIITN